MTGNPSPNPLPASGEGARRTGDTCVVVLDDDPLGGQCIRDVPVLTGWEPEVLVAEIIRSPAFLLLTNTRALGRDEAIERAREVGLALRAAVQATGRPITPVFRSDSTLRGHFCWEMHAFDRAFRGDDALGPVCVFLPYFGEAGRITKDDTQYVVADNALAPVHETEFARDPAFGFEHSHLPTWLEAHSGGEHRAGEVSCVSLDDLRSGSTARVVDMLVSAPDGGAVVVNAVADDDLQAFVSALAEAEANGKRFLCTGAAPFIRARLGQTIHPLLSAGEIVEGYGRGESRLAPTVDTSTGGLTVVGSYVDKTTGQLRLALAEPAVAAFELSHGIRARDARRIAETVSGHLAAGEDVILHTTRAHVPGAAPTIVEALNVIVASLDVRPRYLLAKGGSTASHLATEALGVRRAIVLGHLQPGVPVWRLGEESRWPGLRFVIFPGNVGTPESLAEALRTLRGS